MTALPRLNIFHAYDYYNTSGAQRDLTVSEQNFYNYCKDNHEEICSENTPDNILIEASKLYMDIA